MVHGIHIQLLAPGCYGSVDYNDLVPIRLLAPEISSQIAAGEVIERPASVVKELVENAIDAGAGSISIVVSDAGRKLIEVADDGTGIAFEELPLAISRHATSKLSSSEDLFRISTLGFRGEALASIASVSRLTITTRTAASNHAARLHVEGGRDPAVQLIGAPPGTVVRVEDLFHNVPARLKFLKADTTERRAVDALVTRYALAYPNIRLRLTVENSLALQTAGDGDRRSILAKLYGVENAKELLEIKATDTDMRLSGFISPTTITRSNRREISIFVNGRWVQDARLTAAVVQAYHTLVMVGRFPLGTVFLEIDPGQVDVNVHPAKAEVRFRDPDRVFRFTQRGVRRGLLSFTPVPSVAPQLWRAQGPSKQDSTFDFAYDDAAAAASQLRAATPKESSRGHLPLLRSIGQIGGAYLVAEGPDGLYLIDQHAAHERVLFEKLMRQHSQKNVASQQLLDPVTLALSAEAARLLGSQLPMLSQLGFSIQDFGPNSFQVRAVPAMFSNIDPRAAVRAVVEDFEEDEAPLQEDTERRIAARVCKRLAVKAGQALSDEEQRALVSNLEACESPRTCPHGRPTMIHLSVDLLERQFGRKGAR
jgi:DNA mismatch repair protein MutL